MKWRLFCLLLLYISPTLGQAAADEEILADLHERVVHLDQGT